ncbi:MAG: GNAT family N-acetyltransferase [Pyrinomonadaceae bacterium]
MPDFQIRPATEKDISLLLYFIKELAAYERLSDKVVATEESLRKHLFGFQPRAEVLLAYWQNEPVGFAIIFHDFSSYLGAPGLYLEDLFIKPGYRGRGFGRMIFAHLAELAMTRECSRFEWSVLDWNEPAIKFYESIGAKALDDWRVYCLTENALTDLAASSRDKN